MDKAITRPRITITSHDRDRLLRVVETSVDDPRVAKVAEFLDQELARAEIVAPDAVPATVATMNSRVEYEDLLTGQRRSIDIVYPEDADVDAGRLSILTPVAAALLGLSEGMEITWQLSDGRRRRMRLLKVVSQPEAAGRQDL